MKKLIYFILIALLFSCASKKSQTVSVDKLNGTWIPIAQEMNGKTLPKSFYEKQRLIIEDTLYTVIAESIDRGIVKVNRNKLDIYGKEGINIGKHFTGLFELNKDKLTVCYNLKGDYYPTDFITQNKSTLFTSVFTRLK